MAKGKKTGGRNFKKGWKGGPGRPKLSPQLKATRRMTQTQFLETANKLIFMTRDDLSAKIKDPKSTVMELMLGTVIKEAVVRGDHARLTFVLDRLIGKVPDSYHVTGSVLRQNAEAFSGWTSENLADYAKGNA